MIALENQYFWKERNQQIAFRDIVVCNAYNIFHNYNCNILALNVDFGLQFRSTYFPMSCVSIDDVLFEGNTIYSVFFNQNLFLCAILSFKAIFSFILKFRLNKNFKEKLTVLITVKAVQQNWARKLLTSVKTAGNFSVNNHK